MTVSDAVIEAEELKDFLKNVCKAENNFGNHNSKSPLIDLELIVSTHRQQLRVLREYYHYLII